MRLMGTSEVCAYLDLRRMELKRLRDREQFPKPAAELASGPVWRARDIERVKEERTER